MHKRLVTEMDSMPELPEVETMRRGIQAIAGHVIQSVEFTKCRLKPISIGPSRPSFRRRVKGRRVSAVGRIGKRVVVHLDSGDSVVFEPRMTGLLLVTDPPNREHLRLGIHFRKTTKQAIRSIWFWDRRGLGSVRVFDQDELAMVFGPDRVGPDALGVTATDLRNSLGKSSREIKVALLDQRAVAGIGNLYASEILHVAGIHPQKRCHQMTAPMWQALQDASRRVLSAAIKYEGSTLGDGTYRNALNKDGSYQNQHRVYMRAGTNCSTCKAGEVQRIVQAQRSTFFCPTCQTKRAKAR